MRGWVYPLQLLLILASAVDLRSGSRRTHDHISLSQIRDSPNLEGQVPVFIFPRNRLPQLYPQALGSLSVASYDSQGYCGGIVHRLHTDKTENTPVSIVTVMFASRFRGNVFSEPLLRSSLNNILVLLLSTCTFALPSNSRCLQSHR
jgi:hypothetical protein